MSGNNKVPEIRFRGFSGEWEENTLSEIANVIDPHPSHRAPDAVDNGIPFIGIGDISDVGLVDLKNVRIVPNSIYSEHSARYTIEKGDFAYGRVASVGKIIDLSNNVGCEYTYSPTMAIVKPTNIYPAYLRNYLQTGVFKDLVANKTSGSTRKSLGVQDFRCLPVLFPSKEEQAAIGNYIQKLDTLINQHQQKHDKLCNIKKAMLEKMFPKQGETVPEIRFKGFSGAWDEIELGEEVTFINGRAYSQEELQDKGKYTILRVGNFYTNSSWYYSDMELSDKYYADYGDLLYTWSASFGPHIWNGDKVIYHYHIWKLELSENIEKLFLLHLLDYDRAKILSGSNGSTMIHITKSAMEAKKVFIPKKEEQTAIGNYFQKLDTLINQHQLQITKLNNIKQACLSKMFV